MRVTRRGTVVGVMALLALLPAHVRAQTGTWKGTERMLLGRYAPTLTRLADGGALIAGGYDGIRTTQSAQLFHPRFGNWRTTGGLQTGRNFATATLLDDGSVLVAGGFDSFRGSLNTAELYSPKTGMFRVLPSRMTTRRELFTATKLPDGRVLLAGGLRTSPRGGILNTAEIYDPKTKAFTPTGTMTAPYGRFGHDAIHIPGTDLVLVVGGKERSPSGWASLRSAELYDASTGAFTRIDDMKRARDRVTLAWVEPMKKVLVIGGQSGGPEPAADVRETEWFDPTTRAFSPGPSLAQGRMGHTLTMLKDGSFLVAGGWSVALGRTTETAERFIPFDGAFVSAGTMAASRHDAGAILLPDGRVLIAGGKKADSTGAAEWLSGSELYSP